MSANPLPVADLDGYLAARKGVLAARQGLFEALRSHLHPAQRPDAERLGDPLANAKARTISEEDWVDNPVRGYLTVLESAPSGRPFRLCVLQQGHELRVGLRFLERPGSQHSVQSDLETVFQRHRPMVRFTPDGPYGSVFVDWHFDTPNLYESALAFEDAIFKVGAVFEAALQAMVAAEPAA